eukprot:CAMPEP_0196663556 /NCGR_PEP_ID=MMETSP1086-20130531/53333_1 /TAXON_ID=77921 /ORGANISM="Cyanoptyche  gloeocystis , Strain SAG4.97" /LENGTH=430 /DNA_ID=CAMNT_0041999421 /DNA_START=289 /DNA_END=1581 /DNA_ORIENTATION=+
MASNHVSVRTARDRLTKQSPALWSQRSLQLNSAERYDKVFRRWPRAPGSSPLLPHSGLAESVGGRVLAKAHNSSSRVQRSKLRRTWSFLNIQTSHESSSRPANRRAGWGLLGVCALSLGECHSHILRGGRRSRIAGGGGTEGVQGPLHVLEYEWVRLAVEDLLEDWDGRGIARVAEGDGHVAEEAAALDAEDGGVAEALLELVVVHPDEVREDRSRDLRCNGPPQRAVEVRVGSVPRTHGLAHVAAVDVVADETAQVERYAAFELDGQVRDAEARVQHERTHEGLSWAKVEALAASSTTFVFQARHLRVGIGRQREGCEDFADEETAARLRVDQHRVLTAKTEPCPCGKVPLVHRASVHEPAAIGAPIIMKKLRQDGQLVSNDFVVICSPGITRDVAMLGVLGLRREFFQAREIALSNEDDGFYSWKYDA